jgi:hypothetical protein
LHLLPLPQRKNGETVRIWSFHPKYLDSKGLIALWRESLLAQKVLKGETTGYRNHPQLSRFRSQPDPAAAIATYLEYLFGEAVSRGYRFDHAKIEEARSDTRIPVTEGQLLYEWELFREKLKTRDLRRYLELPGEAAPEPHPSFRIVAGDVETWERRKISGTNLPL